VWNKLILSLCNVYPRSGGKKNKEKETRKKERNKRNENKNVGMVGHINAIDLSQLTS